jgi:hypothetical protein
MTVGWTNRRHGKGIQEHGGKKTKGHRNGRTGMKKLFLREGERGRKGR